MNSYTKTLRLLLLGVFYFSLQYIAAQGFKGCIEIDFETIPEEATLSEGLTISDQFYNQFGLTFELENGGFPVLAQVGEPVTAFTTPWGSDTPAPGVDIGRFFITDDGILGPLTSPALILRFETPIDSFAGCILDIDFGENFIIEAMDQNGDILIDFRIVAGDEGTGDGLQTCWGFNLDGCEGTVYSIRYSGFRTQSGGFGLGMDNFSFCINNADYKKEDAFCLSDFGQITMINLGTEDLMYSIDGGVTFQSDPVFSNVPPGDYSILSRDQNGCESIQAVTILGPYDYEAEVMMTPMNCDDNDAIIEVNSFSLFPSSFSLNGMQPQDTGLFTDLPAGVYNILITDINDCTAFVSVEVPEPQIPNIESIQLTDEFCRMADGAIQIFATGGTPPYDYSINNTAFQNSSIFSSLAAGDYDLIIRDALGCVISETVTIVNGEDIELGSVEVIHPDCFIDNGVISVFASGPSPNLMYTINGTTFQSSNTFENLPGGTYNIKISDDAGCILNVSADLIIPLCPIYIPNIITGNNDFINDEFIIYTNPNYGVGVLQYHIYDRWGELVFKSGDFSIHKDNNWWDGYFNGVKAENGVYTYLIFVKHPNGTLETLTGDVTLLR